MTPRRKRLAIAAGVLLALAAATALVLNAFRSRFYRVELENIVDAMDNNYHDTFQQIFELYHDMYKADGKR